MTIAPEMQALKTRLKAMWMADDYGHFAHYLEPGAMEFLSGLRVTAGEGVADLRLSRKTYPIETRVDAEYLEVVAYRA